MIFFLLSACSTASGALLIDNIPFAVTVGAGSDIHKLAEDAPLRTSYLPCAVTLWTLSRSTARLAAGAIARGTVLRAQAFDFLFASKYRLLECEAEVIANVRPLLWSSSCGCSRAAEEGVEYIAETAKHIETLSKPLAGMPEAVVVLSLHRVGEYLVSLVYLFKSFGSAIILVVVGMVLEGEFPEGAFNVAVCGGFRDA